MIHAYYLAALYWQHAKCSQLGYISPAIHKSFSNHSHVCVIHWRTCLAAEGAQGRHASTLPLSSSPPLRLFPSSTLLYPPTSFPPLSFPFLLFPFPSPQSSKEVSEITVSFRSGVQGRASAVNAFLTTLTPENTSDDNKCSNLMCILAWYVL